MFLGYYGASGTTDIRSSVADNDQTNITLASLLKCLQRVLTVAAIVRVQP